jgi:hypothetical protein
LWWMWKSRWVTNVLSMCSLIWTFVTHPLVHIYQKKKIAPKIAGEIANVNGPLQMTTLRGYAPQFPWVLKEWQNWYWGNRGGASKIRYTIVTSWAQKFPPKNCVNSVRQWRRPRKSNSCK